MYIYILYICIYIIQLNEPPCCLCLTWTIDEWSSSQHLNNISTNAGNVFMECTNPIAHVSPQPVEGLRESRDTIRNMCPFYLNSWYAIFGLKIYCFICLIYCSADYGKLLPKRSKNNKTCLLYYYLSYLSYNIYNIRPRFNITMIFKGVSGGSMLQIEAWISRNSKWRHL